MPRLRVLHLIHDLGTGGAEKQLVTLCERLPRDRFEVEVCTILDRGGYRDRLRAAGIPLHTLGARGLADFPAAAGRLYRLLRARRPDLLQTWLIYSDLLGRLTARAAGVPALVNSMRNTDDWRKAAHVLADRWTARAADRVVSNSLAGARRLVDVERIPAGRIRVIHNGIDAAAFAAGVGDGPGMRRPQDPLVGAAGRLHPQKDFPLLLRAFAALRARHPAARLVVAGEGAERGALERLAAGLGLAGAVDFPGEVRAMAPFLAGLDLVVLTSAYEGLPNVLLEAGALGRPVVAAAVGGVPEIVRHERSGLLVATREPADFAAAMASLLDAPERAARLGAALRERVRERFSVERMVGRHAELYEALARRASPPARPPLRILHVITRTDVGGAQKHVADLARLQARRGLDVTVAAGRGGSLLAYLDEKGIATRALPTLDRDIAPLADLRALRDLFRLVRELRPDLVHCHSSKAGLLGRLAARLAGVPAVFTAHGFAFYPGLPPAKYRLYEAMERLGGRLGAGLIAVSGRDLATAREHRIGEGKPRRAIANGIDADGLGRRLADRAALRAAWGVGEDETLVGTLGRFCDEKAFDLLARAVALLGGNPAAAAAKFVIMGEGERKGEIAALVGALGIPGRLRLADGAPPDRLPYAAFDLYVLPSRKEGFPYTLLEAGAAGLAAVATDVGGVGEILVDGDGGRLVQPESPEALAAGLADLLGRGAAERRALGDRFRARVRERFTLEGMVDATMAFYEEVLGRGR